MHVTRLAAEDKIDSPANANLTACLLRLLRRTVTLVAEQLMCYQYKYQEYVNELSDASWLSFKR